MKVRLVATNDVRFLKADAFESRANVMQRERHEP